MVAFASPAVVFVPAVLPESEPFVWLALVGMTVAFSSPNLTEREVTLLEQLMEDIESLPRSARLIYLLSFAFMLVFGLSTLVGAVGLVGAVAVATAEPLTALAAVPVALTSPVIDIWLRRNVGWNLTSTGAVVALLPLVVFDRLSQSPNVSKSAFRRVRGLSG